MKTLAGVARRQNRRAAAYDAGWRDSQPYWGARSYVGGPGIAGAAAVGTAAAIGTAGAVAATSYNWGWGGTSSDHALYFKNLRDAGYNPKDNFDANGTIKSQ